MARADQPCDPRREDARLAAARAGENQRMLLGQCDCGKLFGIEVFEMKRQSARIISRAHRSLVVRKVLQFDTFGSLTSCWPRRRAASASASAFDGNCAIRTRYARFPCALVSAA